MKSITAKHCLLVLLALLLVSGWRWHKLTVTLGHAEGLLEQALHSLQQAKNVERALPPPSTAAIRPLRSLSRELAETVLHIERNRALYQIEITNMASSKTGVSREAQPLGSLTETIAQTDGSIQFITLKIKAVYRNYQGLQHFLVSLIDYPIAIRRLDVNEENFEAELLIIGAAS